MDRLIACESVLIYLRFIYLILYLYIYIIYIYIFIFILYYLSYSIFFANKIILFNIIYIFKSFHDSNFLLK